ncbi:MAG: GspH/FimT family pseudopilin [Gemmatimonadaceae bacterium]
MRHAGSGFTLLELLIVVVISGMLAMMAAPRISAARNTANLVSAREQLSAAISTARAAAIQKGQPVTLRFTAAGPSATVVGRTGAQLRIVAPVDLRTQYGVTVSTRTDTIRFDSRGLAAPKLGGRAVFRLTGAAGGVDSVCVGVLGQIMPRGCSL